MFRSKGYKQIVPAFPAVNSEELARDILTLSNLAGNFPTTPMLELSYMLADACNKFNDVLTHDHHSNVIPKLTLESLAVELSKIMLAEISDEKVMLTMPVLEAQIGSLVSFVSSSKFAENSNVPDIAACLSSAFESVKQQQKNSHFSSIFTFIGSFSRSPDTVAIEDYNGEISSEVKVKA